MWTIWDVTGGLRYAKDLEPRNVVQLSGATEISVAGTVTPGKRPELTVEQRLDALEQAIEALRAAVEAALKDLQRSASRETRETAAQLRTEADQQAEALKAVLRHLVSGPWWRRLAGPGLFMLGAVLSAAANIAGAS